VLNFAVLSQANIDLWEERINNTSPAFVLNFGLSVPIVASAEGCPGYVLNGEDFGQTSDNYGSFWAVCVNENIPNTDNTCLTNVVAAKYVTGKNRADCGNCYLVTPPPSAQVIANNPTINFCDNAFANSTNFDVPTTTNLGVIQSSQSAFCLQCAYWNITNDQPNSVLYYTALNAQGTLSLTFPVPIDAQLLFQYQVSCRPLGFFFIFLKTPPLIYFYFLFFIFFSFLRPTLFA
jgi:hypothetical protein